MANFVTSSGGYATHWSGNYNITLGVSPSAGQIICVCIRYTPGHAGATPSGTGWTQISNALIGPQNEVSYMIWAKVASGSEGTTVTLVRNAGAQISWSTAFLVEDSAGIEGSTIGLQSASTSVPGPSLTASAADSLGIWWTSRYAVSGASPTYGSIVFNSGSEQALVGYEFGPGSSGTNTITNVATHSTVVAILFGPVGGGGGDDSSFDLDAETPLLVGAATGALGLSLTASAQTPLLVGAASSSLALGFAASGQTSLLVGDVESGLALGFAASSQIPLLTADFSASVGSSTAFSIAASLPILVGSGAVSLGISSDIESTISPLVAAFQVSSTQEQITLSIEANTLALVGDVASSLSVRITSAASLPHLMGSGSVAQDIGFEADGSLTGLQALGTLKLGIPFVVDAGIPLLIGSPVLAIHHLAPSKRTIRILARSRSINVLSRSRSMRVPA